MSFSVPIDKLMCWRTGNWAKFDHGIMSAVLRIHCDQLILFSRDKILESLNIHKKIKGFHKGDMLILVLSNSGSELRKIRFRIQSNVEECLRMLGQHFPVVNHGCYNTNVISSRYRNIDEVLKHSLETMDVKDNSSIQLPPNFSNFVKLCLLDPTFPQFVNATQNVLNSI